MLLSTSDGKVLAKRKIAHPPVFDAMSVARGALFLSLEGGRVVCYR